MIYTSKEQRRVYQNSVRQDPLNDSPKGDGWDSRDGYDEGLCWRGVDKKPIPTKILEAVREGLEDVAYMDFLKGSENVAAKRLLDARDDVIKAND